MFERLTEQGRMVLVLAEDEARSLGHDEVGSGHLLLGLLRQDDDLVEILGEPDDVRRSVVELLGLGEASAPGPLPHSPRAKSVIDIALGESVASQAGPLELALVLLLLPAEATAVKALGALGVVPAAASERIFAIRAGEPAPAEEPGGLSRATRRVLATAARHAEDEDVRAEHVLLALVLEVPDLASRTLGVVDGQIVQERLAGLLEGPEHPGAPGGQDIAILEAALKNVERESDDVVTPEHLLLGVLEVAPDVVARAAVDLSAMEATIRAWRITEDEEPTSRLHRFSPAAREAIARAAEEARILDHAYVGTEHLLLGLLRDEKGAAGRVLADLHVRLGEVRVQVERIVGRGEAAAPAGDLPFTARAKRVLQLALRESFRSSKIDTGHVLLGIERDGEGVAMMILERLGASAGLVRRSTVAMLAHDPLETFGAFAPPSTRAAFASAEDEANTLGHAWVGSEHLLLALLRRGGRGPAALADLGVTLLTVQSRSLEVDGGGNGMSERFLTARLVRAVTVAEELAREEGRPQADDVDLLLGLVRESVGLARTLLGPAADEASLRYALGRHS
jgi:ATP-dependent Clp protease ATP-binding subunit ClpA